MSKLHILFILVAIGLQLSTGNAQKKYTIVYQHPKSGHDLVEQGQAYDSTTLLAKLSQMTSQLRLEGYLFANLDTVYFSHDTALVHFHKGKKYKVVVEGIDERTTQLANALYPSPSPHTLDSATMSTYFKKMLLSLSDKGYPFGRISYSNPIISADEKVISKIKIDPGDLILYDSIYILGKYQLSKKYIYSYLGIKPRTPFNNTKVRQIDKKLADLPFIKLDTFTSVTFRQDRAVVNLFISNKNASRFDFILGFLPTVKNGVRQWNVNGDLSLQLHNKLGYGELLQFKGKQYAANDRQIQLAANWPYLMGTSFGIDGSFELFQNRNLSTDATFSIGANYALSSDNYINLTWQNKSSNLIAIDKDQIIAAKRLPNNLDYTINSIVLGGVYRKLDYRFNPHRGLELNGSVQAGLRHITVNPDIVALRSDQVDFARAYDSLAASSLQLAVVAEASYYLPLHKIITLKINYSGGLRQSQKNILENEYFRLGGNRKMRGFDELSILAQQYHIFTADVRLLLDKNSYISLPFFEYSRSLVWRNKVQSFKSGLAVGAGLNFATAAGIFNISVAAGNNLQGAVDFGNSKLHFGYVNLF